MQLAQDYTEQYERILAAQREERLTGCILTTHSRKDKFNA